MKTFDSFGNEVHGSNRKQVELSDFEFDLKKMFYERGPSGDCYKSFCKWDLPFDRDQMMRDLIAKRNIEDSKIESSWNKASREYLWTRMTEAIFTEEPI